MTGTFESRSAEAASTENSLERTVRSTAFDRRTRCILRRVPVETAAFPLEATIASTASDRRIHCILSLLPLESVAASTGFLAESTAFDDRFHWKLRSNAPGSGVRSTLPGARFQAP
ncbi:MAG TPA: hypothetical protein VN851_01225 [Thermoanaerobaculia bacterium]|nr:hypothetical protein [Thermoanaerobaculia bacterium]